MGNRTLIAWIAALASYPAAPVAAALPQVGDLHPDFKARDCVTGEEFSLSALRGQVVLLKYWATW